MTPINQKCGSFCPKFLKTSSNRVGMLSFGNIHCSSKYIENKVTLLYKLGIEPHVIELLLSDLQWCLQVTKKIRAEGIAPKALGSGEEEDDEEVLEITPPKKSVYI